MPSFIKNWCNHLRQRWEESKIKDFCSIIFGIILFVAATGIGTISWMKGASGIFVALDFLAGTMAFMWSCFKAAEHFSSDWEISKLSRALCSMILGGAIFIACVVIGTVSWMKGASCFFTILTFLTGIIGFMWFLFRATVIFSVFFDEAYESVELNETAAALNNENLRTSRVGDKEDNASRDVMLTKSDIGSLIENLSKSRATDAVEKVSKSEEANPVICVANRETQICKEYHLSGPVPGGRYIQKTEKSTSIVQSPEGTYVPGNTAQQSYVKSAQSSQQPLSTQNSIIDDRPALSHRTSFPVCNSATEDPYVICERIRNQRSFENRSYHESSELFGLSSKELPENSNDSTIYASILCRYPIQHSERSSNKQAGDNTDHQPARSGIGRDLIPQHTLPERKTDFAAEYSKPKSNLLANPHSMSPPPVIPPKTSHVPPTNRRPLPPIPAPRRLPQNSEAVTMIHTSPPLPAPRRTCTATTRTNESTGMHGSHPPVAQRSSSVEPAGRIPSVPPIPPRRINVPVHSQPGSPPPIPKKQSMKY